eukprot:GGOE01062032.1.p1 GENE.GGOE01062032.1~~GGOE01062032.1.p1  ORF type:complete len:551 (-),score=157.08 GGOE01062032.1:95-1747(-)
MVVRTVLPSLFQHKEPTRGTQVVKLANDDDESDEPKCLERASLATSPTDALYTYFLNSPYAYTGGCQGLIRKYNLQTGDELVVYKGHMDIVRQMQVSFDKDGEEQLLFSVSRDKTLRGFDAVTGRQVFPTVTYHAPLECLCLATNSVFVGTSDGALQCVNQQTGEQAGLHRVHSCNVKGIACDGTNVYTCSLDGLAKCVDMSRLALVSIFEGMGPLRCSALTDFAQQADAEQALLLVGSSEGDILGFDRRTSRCECTLKGHGDAVLCLAARQYKVWSGSDDCTVKQWDIRTGCGTCEFTYSGHQGSIKAVQVNSESQLLIGSIDKSVYTWELMDPRKHCRGGLAQIGATLLATITPIFRKHAKSTFTEGMKYLTPRLWKDCLAEVECRNLKVVDALFRSFDTRNDEELDVDTVLTSICTHFLRSLEGNLQQAFSAFDKSGTGQATQADAQELLTRGEQALTQLGLSKVLVLEISKAMEAQPMTLDDFKYFTTSSPKMLLVLLPLALANLAYSMGATKGPATAEEEQALRLKYDPPAKSQGGAKKPAAKKK